MNVHTRRLSAAALTFALATAATAATAIADTSAATPPRAGELSVTDQQSSFSSPGDTVGPWSVQTLQYQWQLDRNDIPSLTLFSRQDNDRPDASSSRALYADDYHTWTSRFYTYAQISAADGDIQPYNLGYLEGDFKLDPLRNIVAAAGAGVTRNPGNTSTRWLSLGPSFYTGPFVFEVRFMPANTNGIDTSAAEGIIQYSRLGHDQITASVQSGSQPSVLVGLPPSFVTFQRLTEYDLVWRHWLTPHFGIVIGGTSGNHDARDTGATLYNQRAITFGVFAGQAVGQPR